MQDTIRDLAPAVIALGRGARRGCGLAVEDGRVLVLAHTLRADRVELLLPGGGREGSTVVGADRQSGLALLAASYDAAPELEWAEQLPALGTEVFSLADPGSGLRVTSGAVSCARVTTRAHGGRAIEMIEHTAPVPAGAGGGPIADAAGAVLGISALRGDPGFVRALPAAAVRAAISRIAEGREPVRLGVALVPSRVARRMRAAVGLPDHAGLLVRGVEDDGPAARAGVRPGDLLVRLGEGDLDDLDALFSALEANAGGDHVALAVVRGLQESELHVDLSAGAA